MIVKSYPIEYKYGDTIKIKPISDVHMGNRYSDTLEFKKFLSDIDDNTYFIGTGDLFDSIVIKDKRYTKHVDDTVSDTIIDEQIDRGYDILGPYKDKILGLGRGNHEQTIRKLCGTDPVERLCKRLGCDYLGYSGLISLNLRENGGRGRKIIIRWHHGWGGGSRTQGADITKYSKDAIHWDADVFLFGHVHKKQADRIPRAGLVGEKLISKPIMLGITGTFLKTYTKTIDSTYSEEKGYPLSEIGGIVLNIKPHRKWVKMWIDL